MVFRLLLCFRSVSKPYGRTISPPSSGGMGHPGKGSKVNNYNLKRSMAVTIADSSTMETPLNNSVPKGTHDWLHCLINRGALISAVVGTATWNWSKVSHTLNSSPPQAVPPFTHFQAGCSQFLICWAKFWRLHGKSRGRQKSIRERFREWGRQPVASGLSVSGTGRSAFQISPLTLTLTEPKILSMGPQISHLSQTSKIGLPR